MKLVEKPLEKIAIIEITKTYGSYVKITADIETGILVVGCILHADGETILLQKGSKQDTIWGGGLHFELKEIDTTAVLNLRPRLKNNSLEILDTKRREQFIKIVRKMFKNLWET